MVVTSFIFLVITTAMLKHYIAILSSSLILIYVSSKDSLKIFENALIDKSIAYAKVESRFQFERSGYFCVDKDSTKNKVPKLCRTIAQ